MEKKLIRFVAEQIMNSVRNSTKEDLSMAISDLKGLAERSDEEFTKEIEDVVEGAFIEWRDYLYTKYSPNIYINETSGYYTKSEISGKGISGDLHANVPKLITKAPTPMTHVWTDYDNADQLGDDEVYPLETRAILNYLDTAVFPNIEQGRNYPIPIKVFMYIEIEDPLPEREEITFTEFYENGTNEEPSN